MTRPDHALERTRRESRGRNRTPSWAGSLSLGRQAHSPMKQSTTIFTFCCVSILVLSTGCDEKQTPLKEGIITRVTWTPEANSKTGLFREKLPDKPQTVQGESYGVDMYGVLYPSHLEVRLVGSRDSHSQIIPFSQIVWLEFGDGGITVEKP